MTWCSSTVPANFFALFLANLYDKQRQVLGEYFEDDWSKIEPVSVEPGHQAEWVWLLKGFERITGCPTGRYRGELLASALRYRDEATGCLIDEGDADGRIRRHTRRLWPQTEIAKAWIAQAEAGEVGAADEARAALTRLERHYLSHPVAGGWYDQFDRDGNSLVATIPASSFYHVALRGSGSRAGARLASFDGLDSARTYERSQPPLPPLEAFQVLETLALVAGAAEIKFLDVLIVAQFVGACRRAPPCPVP